MARSGCCCESAAGSWAMPRLVSYSLQADERRRHEHACQFELSVSSLRASNPAVPVVLFSHGPLAAEIAWLCSHFGVMVRDQGPYADRLAALSPQSGRAMARYPVLHKHLNFSELAAAGVQQVLCCDLDTIFFTDVERVFDRYAGADVVAREEVCSGRSIHGADRAFIDEPLLERLAHHLGRAVVAPINLGVVLYSHGVVARLADIMKTFVDDAWRLMNGLTVREFPNSAVAGSDTSFPWMADVRKHASDIDRQRALPYPSNNGWIVEEVAWWLALGSIPGLTQADFAACDVAQNGEVLGTPRDRSNWALCHYYSHNLQRIVEWLHPRPSHATQAFSYPAQQRRAAQPSATFER
ncbi:hypothetical protein A8M77_24595 [Variovorax sp. JS1663]|nr:hypothetical protein A8M77_24595 [Variovorax sp. JS1663]